MHQLSLLALSNFEGQLGLLELLLTEGGQLRA